jgi:hypothetical protein
MSLKDIKAGMAIRFKGYAPDTPEADQLLGEGTEYVVADVNLKEKSVSVEIENPNFNEKKKVSDTNSKTLLVDVFEEEFELVEEAPAEEEAAAAPAPRARPTGTKPAAKAAPAAAAKAAPAKAAAKPGSAKATAPAPKAGARPVAKPAAAKVEEEAVEEGDPEVEALEQEDAEIVKLVEEAGDNLLGLAQELVEESAAQDYKLGGVLYHVQLGKAHHAQDERYKERGGFGLYVKEQLNIEYRKAMYLIDIYFKFNKFGIDSAKVAALGWTKASKIASVMSEDNAAELVELAETNTVSDLSENIKANYKEVGGTKGERKKLVTFKFKLFEDSAEVVKTALENAAAALGYKKLDQAFEHVVTEWATEHPMKPAAAAPQGRRVAAPAAAPRAAAKPAAAKPVARPAARK